jgi:hypothetical protein
MGDQPAKAAPSGYPKRDDYPTEQEYLRAAALYRIHEPDVTVEINSTGS